MGMRNFGLPNLLNFTYNPSANEASHFEFISGNFAVSYVSFFLF
ncbi:hypothetical protein A33Q_2445 [Indibacter alkaliphilus LW1]|uniref:Uncharacterized protein n=1 Tax=Indibacter alkaliphilus (strain CCUG 57479 / KCTC 22604 / LW1) TaxID=1189612 RepID=S2DHP9_INDAL|nr:hypothetical protein A33Q_2445 [Indibacter alkaliphilus LW1]